MKNDKHALTSSIPASGSVPPLPYLLLINSLRGGGAERQAIMLARHLPPAAICTLEPGQAYDTGNVPVVCLGETVRETAPARLLEVPVFAHRLARYRQPLVVSLLERSNFVNILSRAFFPHAVVVSERAFPSSYYGQGVRRAQLKLIRWSYPRADLVVTNGHATARDLAEGLGVPDSSIRVVPNMLDVSSIRTQAEMAIPPEIARWFDRPVVVSAGRLSREKGTGHLVRAFAEVRRRVRARLLILGDGPLRPHLTALAGGLGLSRDVHFAGFVDRPWVQVARSTIFVLTSLAEGLPNALIEAMACGTPVVSTDCTGAREILDTPEHLDRRARSVEHVPCGVLVPVPSGRLLGPTEPLEPAERHLADAMTELLSNAELRRGYAKAGQARVAMFEPARVVPVWRAVMAEAMARSVAK